MSDLEDLTAAQGVLDGKRYLDSLDDGREVWLDGERVSDVAGHPAFRGAARELARQFDLQHHPDHRDLLTWESPRTGNRLAQSYRPPRSVADLRVVRRGAEFWFRESWGQHGRSPAFMATILVGLYDFRNRLAAARPEFGANAERYYTHVAENDLVLTHALGDPQIDRSADPVEHPDNALRIVAERPDGIVVRGAKQLTTLAPLANEVLVYLSASFARRGAERFVVWFALPLATPGLRILCREPFGATPYGHAHPFAARFDEQDAMLFFEDVLVPWDRVFLLHDGALALEGLRRITAWSAYIGLVRYRERLRTLLAVATLAADSIGVAGFRNIQEDLGELTSFVRVLDHFIAAGEADARPTDGGLLAPGDLTATAVWAAETSGRAVQILRRIGGSGVLMQPTERDLASELRPQLDRYMRGRDIGAAEKSRLFRLAWDLVGDGFGQRQDLYEFVHRGDLARNRINLFLRHDQEDVLGRVRELISRPL
ncbi:4-hydroxyphenylacetate 3-hydroxylase family protein [Marinactinospora rubrisoli]|uniref:4-hydroxyphenylacetate 3-hydroxylase family protein n=1 Tax=Marinactinospora rubrisoli TaxID=2715399 RepID=A0ABW2KD89_9ACTN